MCVFELFARLQTQRQIFALLTSSNVSGDDREKSDKRRKLWQITASELENAPFRRFLVYVTVTQKHGHSL